MHSNLNKNKSRRDGILTLTTQRTSNRDKIGSVNSTFWEKVFEESYLIYKFVIFLSYARKISTEKLFKCISLVNTFLLLDLLQQ